MTVRRQDPSSQGFSLLELSISIGIIGILLGGVLVLAAGMISSRQAIDSEQRLEEIVEAIEHYRSLNSRLPCVASRSTVQGDATFGKEVAVGAACQTYTVAPGGTLRQETSGGSGIFVLIGVLPVRDLLLRDEMMQDAYGNRYSYAVMQSLTNSSTFAAGAGAITVKDGGANNILTDGAFVVFSHGKDGAGAYRFVSGALKAACGATNLDTENCDWDDTFVDAPFNDGAVAASYFDDAIRWKSKRHYQ